MNWLRKLFTSTKEPAVVITDCAYPHKIRFRTDMNKIKMIMEGNLSVIPYMYFEMTNADDSLLMAYAGALTPVVSSLSYAQLIRLDQLVRQNSSLEWHMNWRKFRLESLILPEMSDDETLVVLGLSSCHPSGFVREKSLKLLGAYPSSLTAKFITLRLNDWVDEVSSTARKLFLNDLDKLEIDELIKLLPYVYRLKRNTRVDNTDILDRCVSIFLREENIDKLKLAVEGNDLVQKRICYSFLLKAVNVDVDFLIKKLDLESDQYIKSIILKGIIEHSNSNDLQGFLGIALTNKSVLIRGCAMDKLHEICPTKSHEYFWPMLLDRSAAIRQSARFYIRQQTQVDFRLVYLNSLVEHVTAAALMGIGETGCGSDSKFVLGHISSLRLDIVKAAMQAAVRLDYEGTLPTLITLLGDFRLSVSCQAFKLLYEKNYALYEKDIYAIFQCTSIIHVRRNCAKLLTGLGKWAGLNYIIELAPNEDEWLKEYGLDKYNQWLSVYNRSFILPAQSEKERILDVIKSYSFKLPKKMTERLLFLLSD